MNNQDIYGKEKGNSKVAEGDDVVEFTSRPNTENIENRFDEWKEAPAKPVINPSKAIGFDINRMLGMYDAYKDMTQYVGREKYTVLKADAKALFKAAERFLAYKDAYILTSDMIDDVKKKMEEISPTFTNMAIDSTVRGQNMPESVRRIIVKKFDYAFKMINDRLMLYEPTNNDPSEFRERMEQVNDMYQELNSTNKLNEVIILAKNIEINFNIIKTELTRSVKTKNLYYINQINILSEYAKNKEFISYTYDSDGDIVNMIDNTVYPDISNTTNTVVDATLSTEKEKTFFGVKRRGFGKI